MRDLSFAIAPGLAERGRRAEASGHSVIYVGWGERARAVIALDDTPVPEARATIEALRARGLRMAVLTGDLAPAAHRVAAALGIEDVRAGLSPEDKRAALDRHRWSREVVAMVGDGLNDGPVLVEADVGIAVGTATDLARETASVVLPVGGLWLLPWIIDVARAVRTTVRTNLHLGFRLQSRGSDAGRARHVATHHRRGRHGRLEHSRGVELAAAGATAGPRFIAACGATGGRRQGGGDIRGVQSPALLRAAISIGAVSFPSHRLVLIAVGRGLAIGTGAGAEPRRDPHGRGLGRFERRTDRRDRDPRRSRHERLLEQAGGHSRCFQERLDHPPPMPAATSISSTAKRN